MDLFNSTDFEQHVHDLMRLWHVPGLSMAISHGDEISSEGFGLASIHPMRACTPDSLFDIASSSKSLTAAAIALLVENDEQYPQIKWDTRMSLLLPDDFVMANASYTQDITLEDILSHRTGLSRHDASYLGRASTTPDTAASITRNLRNLAISAPIRSKYQYNNMMFTVATHLIEWYTGMSFSKFLSSHFFQPLGMHSSFVHPSAAVAAGQGHRLVTPYSTLASDGSFSAVPWPEDPEAQGAGGICTSANDYILYVKALMQARQPFSKSILEAVTTPRIITDTRDLDPFESWRAYGLGWRLLYYRGQLVVRHFGGIPGFASVHFFLPAFGFGGVMLGNTPAAVSVQEILMKELIDSVLAVPLDDRVDWVKLMQKDNRNQQRKREEDRRQIRRSLLGDRTATEPLTRPLKIYTQRYHNPGYHTLRVEIKEGRLFIDATDRSMPFTMVFMEHIHSQKVFLVRQTALHDENDFDDLCGEFKFDPNGDTVMALGLQLETALDELIWFAVVDPRLNV